MPFCVLVKIKNVSYFVSFHRNSYIEYVINHEFFT